MKSIADELWAVKLFFPDACQVRIFPRLVAAEGCAMLEFGDLFYEGAMLAGEGESDFENRF